MKAPKKPRAKSAAAVAVPQSREDVIASPNEVKGIAGISIKSDVEDFEIIPFEQTVTD